MQGIYQIKNKTTNKIYIGQSINIEGRIKGHFNDLKNQRATPYLQKAYNKYGKDDFEVTIIEEIEDRLQLNDREIYWIAYFKSNSREYGYNISGGGGNIICSEETKEKIRLGNLGKKLTEDHKKKISEKSKLHKHSKEVKEKIRQAHLGKVLSEETKRKISQANKGRKLSEKAKLNISKGLMGREGWNKGLKYTLKPLSEETKQNISNAQKGKRYRLLISDEQALDILKRMSNGEKVNDLAIEFGVKPTTIYSLKRRTKGI